MFHSTYFIGSEPKPVGDKGFVDLKIMCIMVEKNFADRVKVFKSLEILSKPSITEKSIICFTRFVPSSSTKHHMPKLL